MRTTPLACQRSPGGPWLRHSARGLATLSMSLLLFAAPAGAADLKVMATGVGVGTLTGTGIACGGGSTDCAESYAGTPSVTLTATPAAGSALGAWDGDCAITPPPVVVPPTCTVNMTAARAVRFRFDLSPRPPALTGFTPEEINTYLMANTGINTPARFISVLPPDFRQNWILMSRSESLQTGTAASPRVLLPGASALQVFTVGTTRHSSYPGAHPNAIEYMQWDAGQKNFRFHEIVLDAIPAMGDDIDPGPAVVLRFPPRTRGVSIDDHKCFACHSTRNVLNRGTTPATDGIPPQSVGHKTKPNWDTYDSWGGMLGFNRDRIYQGSVEAAAFRSLLNPWTWVGDDTVRSVMEQLVLQPPGVPDGTTPPGISDHRITRMVGGADDGRIRFGFDPPAPAAPVTTEPVPTGSIAAITTAYSFDRVAGTGTATSVERGGPFVTLHHSTQVVSDEGRGVELFDRLSSGPNPQRVAHELANHRFATGSLAIDVRPIALAIAQRCITVSGGTDLGNTQTVTSAPALAPASTAALAFFNTRHGITSFNQLYDDTRLRAWSLPRRKADIQKIHLDRTIDPYVHDTDIAMPPPPPAIVNGLIQEYGAATSGVAGGTGGADTSMPRLRQEVFRRPIDNPAPDNTVMGGIYVDRELIINTDPLALYRYFLEPLGVSVDKWSMGVRGRSRTYTFADLFGGYTGAIASEMKTGLGLGSLPSSDVCAAVIPMVDTILASLPPTVGAVPKYTDIQRIFNKSCIECHGGLGYPPYHTYGTFLDFSEDENPPAGDRRMTRSYNRALAYTSMPTGPGGTDVSNSYLFQRITGSTTGTPPHLYDPLATNEDCPNGIMPCGGPPMNSADIETIRRWIIGARPYTEGDPHIKTVDGTSYDFQGAGEFVLLRDEGLELQARQTPVTTAGPLGPNGHTGLSSCVSVNTAVAVRVGPHRVTYQPNIQVRGEPNVDAQPRPGTLLLRVDGKVMALDGREIVLASGGRIVRTAATGGIQIEAPGGTVVVVTPGFWTHHQIWYMNIDVRHGRATEGVMGVITPGNWLPALPDGTFLGPRPATSLPQRYQVLYEKFADAWRVTAASSLFDYEAGLSTASFTVASWPMLSPTSCTAPPQPGVPAANAPPVQLAREEAERVCRAVADPGRKANCVTDVMATGEPTFAQTYLSTEQIERNTAPTPPVLGTPKDFAEDLARTVDFTWTRTFDGDRGPLRYRHCIWSSDQGFNLNRCKAVSVPLATPRSLLHVALAVLLVLLVLVVLSRTVVKRRRWLLVLVAVLLLPVIVFYVGRDKTVTATVAQLEAGRVYFWKVVADDGHGALVESQTRRLVVKR